MKARKAALKKPFIIEPPFFSNWADQLFPKLANLLIPLAIKIKLTPNIITFFSFFLYSLACLLIAFYPNYPLLVAILLPLAYIFDCLDGQLARTKQLSSPLGDYLDKTLDVLKVYILTLSLSLNQFFRTGNSMYFILGFTACFGFNFRYYIKLETMFSVISRDKEYLEKSRELRYQLYEELANYYQNLSKTFLGKLKILWYKNRVFLFIDEAEFVVVTSFAAIFNRLDIALWIFAVGHFTIAIFRLIERGYQINVNSQNLLKPMRK